jgi:hypothetical protein
MRYMQKRKAKSRLKITRRRKVIKRIGRITLAIEVIVCIALWGLVFDFLKIISILEQPVSAYQKVLVVEKADHSLTEKEKILNYIVEVFGEDSADAITIINKCENHAFDPKATNWNSNGTWDTGIFQINQIHGYTMDEMQDWHKNIDAAKKIFDNRGWTAWSCSYVVGVKSFWQ